MCQDTLSKRERSVFSPPDGKGKTATGVFQCLSTSSVASYSSTVLRQSSTVEDKLEVVTEDTFHEKCTINLVYLSFSRHICKCSLCETTPGTVREMVRDQQHAIHGFAAKNLLGTVVIRCCNNINNTLRLISRGKINITYIVQYCKYFKCPKSKRRLYKQ